MTKGNEMEGKNEVDKGNEMDGKKEVMVLEVPSDDMYICTNINEGQLPKYLEDAMTIVDSPAQQDMLLLSTLTALSYALPHMKLLHGLDKAKHTYYPNMMTLIIAPPASGKGVMNEVKKLIAPIHKVLKANGSRATIPANSSSAAFFELINKCQGNAFMIETEMDVLSKIWKKDYGNYSELFRQAFEHETFSVARKGSGNADPIEVEHPQLSVLLSGTPNQVNPLIGSGEDGLASRFMPYIVTDVMPFDKRVLAHNDSYPAEGGKDVFEQLGEELLARWKWLKEQDHDCIWSLTDEQADVLGDILEDAYMLAYERKVVPETSKPMEMPLRFTPAFNRMVVSIKRIGLILSALRLEVGNELPEVLYCSDEDFKTLVMLAEKLLRHAVDLTLMQPEEKMVLPLNRVDLVSEAERKAEAFWHDLPIAFSTTEALSLGKKNDIERRTVEKYLKILIDQKKVIRVRKGTYKKSKE